MGCMGKCVYRRVVLAGFVPYRGTSRRVQLADTRKLVSPLLRRGEEGLRRGLIQNGRNQPGLIRISDGVLIGTWAKVSIIGDSPDAYIRAGHEHSGRIF